MLQTENVFITTWISRETHLTGPVTIRRQLLTMGIPGNAAKSISSSKTRKVCEKQKQTSFFWRARSDVPSKNFAFANILTRNVYNKPEIFKLQQK